MDFVDEKERALSDRAAPPRVLEDFFQVVDAGKNRRDLDESKFRLMSEEARDGRFAGAGRTPEDQAAERAAGDASRQRAFRSHEMVLAHHLGECFRAQTV